MPELNSKIRTRVSKLLIVSYLNWESRLNFDIPRIAMLKMITP